MSDESAAKELFLDALDLEPGEREAFLRSASMKNDALAARVQALLAAHEHAERRLQRGGTVALGAGLLFGPYRLIEPLGEGGFGVVWRARQDRPVRRDVALKILRSETGQRDGVARFEVERQTLASLTHPGIAQVYEGGSAHGRPWFAMELVDGVGITTHVERARAGIDQRLALFLDVCRAIQHAHQRGVIHRDVKPSNVLVATIDGAPVVKVIDFGIALVEADTGADWTRRTLTGQVLGTPGSMSPEQLVDTRDVDTRSDVYSLGVLLYELLAGAPPFDHVWLRARGPSEALRVLREEDPPLPSVRAAGLGRGARALRGELDWIVMRCLEKDRERRYPSVAELAADVERHRRGEPVLAARPSRLYRAQKFVRRHALAVSALVVTVLALVVGAGLAVREARNARRAEVLAEEAAALADRKAEEARLEAQRFQSIAEFFEHVLLSIDPAIALGRDTSLLGDVLDSAVSGIADRGDRPPEVEATLRRAIGGAYAALAEYDASLAQLDRALELRRTALGEDAPETIELVAERAGVLFHAGRLQQAEAPLADALARARRVLGDDDARTIEILSNHASLARALGRNAEAIALMTELEERRIRVLGREHEQTLLVTSNLALAMAEGGRVREAAERLHFVMEAQLDELGDEHPRALAAMGNYAMVLDALGRLDEAEELHRRVLEGKLRVLEPSHPSVLVSRNNLAEILERAGRFDEALEMFEAALDDVRPDTDQQAKLFVNYSDCLRHMGRADEAVEASRAAREAALAAVGPEGELVRICDGRLADALLDAGEHAESEEVARRQLAAAEADPESTSGSRAEARMRIGLALAALGRHDDARSELAAGLAEPTVAPEWRARGERALAGLGAGR